jgi:hypothetical protein
MFDNLGNESAASGIGSINAIFGKPFQAPFSSSTYNAASLLPYTAKLTEDEEKYIQNEAKRLKCGNEEGQLTEADVKAWYTRMTGKE